MVKRRGLPSTFQLDVPREALKTPVQLGEYLDEDEEPARRIPEARPKQPPLGSVSSPPIRENNIVDLPLPVPAIAELEPELLAPPTPDRRTLKSPPRKQLNMNPETLRMVDELLHYLQSFSGQKDAKVSEMFHGMVLALYEARDLLNFSNVQPRGRWGTPMARAFPISLKNVFRAAIAESVRRNRQ